PVQVDATVFSPFIPLNAKESATPGTVLRYTVKNTSSAPLNIDLTGWLQNLVCIDLKDEANGRLRNRVIKKDGMASVIMDLVKADHLPNIERRNTIFQDFESGSYGKWKAEGTAFGKR